eukprot:5961381-Lingulodinium_polyedra.AAC.1
MALAITEFVDIRSVKSFFGPLSGLPTKLLQRGEKPSKPKMCHGTAFQGEIKYNLLLKGHPPALRSYVCFRRG